MQIKALNKLPSAAKSMWNELYKKAKETHSDERAAKIAWTITKSKFVKSTGKAKKSMVFESNADITEGNYIDVMIGYPAVDSQGIYQPSEFWDYAAKNSYTLKGDMEHAYTRRADGEYINDFDDFEGWIPIMDDIKVNDKGEAWAKVELPTNHQFTPTFVEGWKSGKYGVSTEYVYPEEAETSTWVDGNLVSTINQGTFTGFSFTENPAFEKTKINKKE